MAKRQNKYYVSERKPSCIGMGWHRLTKYYPTEIEARNELSRLSHHYETLAVRVLYPNNTRKTLKDKNVIHLSITAPNVWR